MQRAVLGLILAVVLGLTFSLSCNSRQETEPKAGDATKVAPAQPDSPANPASQPPAPPTPVEDHIKKLQAEAVKSGKVAWGHWGASPEKYSTWKTHSNRLIPIYAFGMSLDSVRGKNSIYRDADRLTKLYGRLPEDTVNPTAEYFDQTDVYQLQKQAADAGKKRIVLMVFDGCDWQTSRNAAICKQNQVAYKEGRGTGLAFQDYQGAPTDFGYFVTAPHDEGAKLDVNTQTIVALGDQLSGYDWQRAGLTPWATASDLDYPIGKSKAQSHAYTDSAASATSLCTGIKTYNDSINVDIHGQIAEPLAQRLQSQGWAIGVVTSVPISHATPACAYANNVFRDDYQDLTRDLVGLPSISHQQNPLPGVDVLIGGGWGEVIKTKDLEQEAKLNKQGANLVPGNRYITAEDLNRIDAHEGGKYVVALRKAGQTGASVLNAAARQAADQHQRLFGFFGVAAGHLPFRTADGKFDPTDSVSNRAEKYTAADIAENPVLADEAVAAMDVLESTGKPWWLMVEAGDVDWANHTNNIDNSIGAVLSGEAAFSAIASWIENHGGWDNTVVLVTADHGHYFFLDKPEALISPAPDKAAGK